MVNHIRKGSVLILALLATVMITILVGSMAAYFVTTARFANGFVVQRSVPRQVAMAALKNVEQMIGTLVKEANENPSALSERTKDDPDENMDIVNKVKEEISKYTNLDDYFGGNYHVILDASPSSVVEDPETGKWQQLTITATVYPKKDEAGNSSYTDSEILAILEMIVKFRGGAPGGLTLPEIFKYVYFVDNYGHLESEAVVVNGDVHSNDKFTIKWGVVNGKVTSGTDKFEVDNARAWPEKTYVKKVKAFNDSRTLTSTRPTDPIASQTWKDGYPPATVSNPYAGDYETQEAKPTVVHPDEYKPTQARPGAWTETEPKLEDYITDVKYDARKVKYYYYLYGQIRWSSSALISARNALRAEHDSNVAAATAKYQADLASYNSDKTAYANLVKAWAEYDAYVVKYNNHTTDAEVAWQSRAEEWNQNRADWDMKFNNGETEAELKSAKDASNTLFLKSGAEIIKMLNMSDTNAYKNLCVSQKGKLTCLNQYLDGSTVKRISWRHRGQMDAVAMMVRKASKANVLGEVQTWSDWSLDSDGILTKLIIASRDGSNPWLQESTIQMRRELTQVVISNGYNKGIYPFSNYSRPCTYTAQMTYLQSPITRKYGTRDAQVKYPAIPNAVKALEKGSVVLIGTSSYPITIDGPVFIDGDVVLRGVVSGRGTIYSGRNIHIIGDLVYKNPPSWPYDSTGLSGTSQNAIRKANAGKDILLLGARGNIVIGDYTSADWTDSKNSQYLKSLYGSASSYGDTYDDDDIGYENFTDRDYTQYDGLKKVYFKTFASGVTWSDLQNKTPVMKVEWYSTGTHVGLASYEDYNWYYAPEIAAPSQANCKYYECLLGDEAIKGLKQISNAEAAAENEPSASAPPFSNGQAEKNQNSGDITQIDGILFANHGIFGVVGGNTSHKFILNGAMACRDEALFPSFDARFKGKTSPSPQLWLNWDMRFVSDELTDWVAISTGSGGVTNEVSSWRQVK